MADALSPLRAPSPGVRMPRSSQYSITIEENPFSTGVTLVIRGLNRDMTQAEAQRILDDLSRSLKKQEAVAPLELPK